MLSVAPAKTSDMEAPLARPGRKRKDMEAAAGPSDPAAAAGGGGNRLLAGFLACGTVLGDRLAPGVSDPGSEAGRVRAARYEAVAVLVQGGGARLPGVVNPAQLASWARR